jgi:hypothetical protein
MATRSDIEAQIRGLINFLESAQSRELTPQHIEFLKKRLYALEKRRDEIEAIEMQPGFRNKKILKGIGNLLWQFPQAKVLKALRGTRGKQGTPFGNVFDAEYEVLGEEALPSIERLITPPAGPPAPEGYIPFPRLPPIETPPPVDFEQLVIGPGSLPGNVQNYLQWQDKMIKELPANPTPQQFISNQAEFLDMHTRGLQERLNLNPSQVERIKTSFGDEVGTHWPMFDPLQNTTSTIGTRIAEHIEGMADKLVKQAASVGIASLADERFERVATDPDYAVDTGTIDLHLSVPIEKQIDPVFLSTSPLREHLVSKHFSGSVGKGDLDPAVVLDELGIALTDSGVGFKNKSKKGRLSKQVIDSGVANLLRNRMREGKTVTKEELIRVLDHHRGQFSTEITFGNETEFRGRHYSDLTLARQGDNLAPAKEDVFEIVSKYRPVLEEGGKLGSSPFSLKTGGSHRWASDAAGDMHFWIRGDVLEYADGLKGPSVGEIQSDMGWAESSEHPEYAWLSDMTDAGSEEITEIKNRQESFEEAYEVAKEGLPEGTDPWQAHGRSPIVNAVRDLASGNLPRTYAPESSWIEPVGRVLSDLNPAFGEEFNALHNKARESAINSVSLFGGFDNVLLDKQPFAKEFGIELTKEDVDIPLSDIGAPWKQHAERYETGSGDALDFAGGYARALRSRLLEKYPHDFGDIPTAFQNGMTEVDQLMLDQYTYAMDENASDFYKLFTKEAIAPLLNNDLALKELYAVGQNAPTEAELEKLTEYQEQQSNVTSLADFPMKKTYPRYSARILIEKGLAQGWDTVEIPDLPPGQKGSVESYPNAVAELKKIAKEFKLPMTHRAAVMQTATGEKGRGMADRLITFYRADIRPLRALIEAEEFEGFIGMKHGGLVTKAQGAGYSMNYGDYGRSYK